MHAPDHQFVVVARGSMRKLHAGLFAEDNLSAGPGGQFAMTTHEVCMQMGLNDVFDLEILCGGFLDILIDIALRIDDRGFAIRADQIRSMGKTVEIKLLEVHRFLPKPILPLTCG